MPSVLHISSPSSARAFRSPTYHHHFCQSLSSIIMLSHPFWYMKERKRGGGSHHSSQISWGSRRGMDEMGWNGGGNRQLPLPPPLPSSIPPLPPSLSSVAASIRYFLRIPSSCHPPPPPPSPFSFAPHSLPSSQLKYSHHSIFPLLDMLNYHIPSPELLSSSNSPSSNNRPVVVDSLLCFLQNFRHLSHLPSILLSHFPAPSFVRSLQLLTQLSPGPDDILFTSSSSSAHNPPEDVLSLIRSLLNRFERLSSSNNAPMFAAADLLSLPFRPIFPVSASAGDMDQSVGSGDGETARKGDVLRHILFMLQQIWLQQQFPTAGEQSGGGNR